MKQGTLGKILGAMLVFVVIVSMLGALPSIVTAASKFNIGDTVEVTTNLNVRTGPGTGYLEITDPDYPGYAPAGTKGTILDGPTNADGYTWWKVDFGSGLYSGWSVEDGLEKVASTAISARIDSYSPSSRVEVTVGGSTTISVTFTNTGNTAWSFIAGATVWDSGGSQVANYSKTLSSSLQPGQQTTVSWTHPINQAGDYWLQFGVWKATPYTAENLLDKKPSPSQNLIRGVTAPQPTIDYSPSSFSFSATQGGSNPSSQTLSIRNSGTGTLNWSVSDAAAWLSLSPASGSSTGETDSVAVSVSISGMNAGSYSAAITISASGATNTPQTVPISLTIGTSPKPDLVIDTITWSPTSPSIGETVTFTVTIKNEGTGKAGTSKVYYFIDGTQQGYDYVSSLDPGATTTETFTWEAQDGVYAIKAVVDYNEEVTESDETNNGKTVTYSATALSDLVIESIAWLPDSPSIGETVTFTITIKNQGVGKAGNCKVYYFIDDVQQGYDSVYSLDPNATLTETFTWNAEEGSHTVKVVADYNDEVTEGDETNNEKMVTVVPPSVLARIDSHYPAAPLEVQVGEPVTLGVTFTNIGNKAWTFYAAASLRRPDGTEEHLQLKPVSLTSGEQDSATWNYTVDKEGGWDVVFGIWKEQEQINSLGHTGWMSNYIVVSAENKPPVARLNLDYAYVESGTPVSFDASGSYDQEGAELIYEWDFGDGTVRVGREFKSIEHRFRGSMISADSLEIQTKSYTVTLTVRDDKGATTSDSATIEVKPLQKSLKIIPPPRPVPTGAFARMTAYYNWVGVAEDTGENIYVVSTIHFEAQGFISYVLSVWDEYSLSIGVPAWSKGLVYFGQPVEKTYAYPFESSRDWTHTFGNEYFEGMAVGSSDKMRLWAFSIEEISGVLGPTWDGVSVSFGLETESEPLTAEGAPDTFVAHLGSSAEMRVYDLQRQVTGVIDGKIRTDIPHSGFCDDTVVILWPTGSYTCEVVGTTEGTYDLAMVTVGKKTSTFAHTDVTTSAGAVHQYDIDWGAVVEGEKDVTMRIDSDGDGKFETVKHLTAQEESPWVWIVVAGVSGLLGVLVGAFMVRRRMSKKQST